MMSTTNFAVNQIKLRKATVNDSTLLLSWRNDEATRANSLESAFITYDQHEKWFLASLQNRNRQIFIAIFDGQPIGMIRFDFHDELECFRSLVNMDLSTEYNLDSNFNSLIAFKLRLSL